MEEHHQLTKDPRTPWLTTRRRTCPICKGDVVRSLARGSPSSPRYEPYQDDSDDDDDDDEEVRAQRSSTPSPSSSPEPPPTPRQDGDEDIERGVLIDAPHDSRSDNHAAGSWLGALSGNFRRWSSRSGDQAQQHQQQQQRDVRNRDR